MHHPAIGFLNVDTTTGIKTFVDQFACALEQYGDFDVNPVDISKESVSRLRQYDILYFPTLTANLVRHIRKLRALGSQPKKVFTVHGWVKEESRYGVRRAHGFGAKGKQLLAPLVHEWFYRTGYFDLVTTPSPTTKMKNGLDDARVIPNGIFVSALSDRIASYAREPGHPIRFVTYSNIGGGKDRTLSDLLECFLDVYRGASRPVTLNVFGRVPKEISPPQFPPCIRFRGLASHDQFLDELSQSDLFVTFKRFPDLGYAELEAAALSIPIAKLWTNSFEELTDGITGIVAQNSRDMSTKLQRYVAEYPRAKKRLGSNLHEYVKVKYDWSTVITTHWVPALRGLMDSKLDVGRSEAR